MPSPAPAATLAEVFARWAAHRPDDVVVVLAGRGDAREVTRAEIVRAVRDAARGMLAVGVEPGDRVVIARPTSIELLAAFWATQLLAAVAVPAWPPPTGGKLWGAGRLRRILDCSQAPGGGVVAVVAAPRAGDGGGRSR
jgi:acyl-CoA synthetase (AMP-forming)/AMP-acid ligase II